MPKQPYFHKEISEEQFLHVPTQKEIYYYVNFIDEWEYHAEDK